MTKSDERRRRELLPRSSTSGGVGLLGEMAMTARGVRRRQFLHDGERRHCRPGRRGGSGRHGDAVGGVQRGERRQRELLRRPHFRGVDCWGDGELGQLGDGTFYTTGNDGTAVPVAVVGVGDTGTLSGVSSVLSDDSRNYFCAVLTSGGVGLLGRSATDGQLGDGDFYT